MIFARVGAAVGVRVELFRRVKLWRLLPAGDREAGPQ